MNEETAQPTPLGQAAFDLLPKYNGIPVVPLPTLFPQNFMNMAPNAGTTRFNNSPQYQNS